METKGWLLHKHYAHRMPNITQAYGAFEGSIMKGVITFGMPASYTLCEGVCGKEFKDQVWELNRLVVDDDRDFETSQFVSGALKRLGQLFSNGKSNPMNGRIIVSYADTGMGHVGKIYQATNFLYTGATKERTDPASGTGHHRHKPSDGGERQIRTSKHRYVIFVGKRQFKKSARIALKYEVLPYPEGDPKRYDASYVPESQTILNL